MDLMPEAQLLKEQFSRLTDNISARFSLMDSRLEQITSLEREKLAFYQSQIDLAAKAAADHESRIRAMEASLGALKTHTSLWQAAQAALTLIASTIAAFLGSRN